MSDDGTLTTYTRYAPDPDPEMGKGCDYIDKKIVSGTVGDFNGDGLSDIIFEVEYTYACDDGNSYWWAPLKTRYF